MRHFGAGKSGWSGYSIVLVMLDTCGLKAYPFCAYSGLSISAILHFSWD